MVVREITVRIGDPRSLVAVAACAASGQTDLQSHISIVPPYVREEPPGQPAADPGLWCPNVSGGFRLIPRSLCSEWAPVCGRRRRWILQPGFGGVLQSCHGQVDTAANQHEYWPELRRSVFQLHPPWAGEGRRRELAYLGTECLFLG